MKSKGFHYLSASTIVICKVPSLSHETGYDTVKVTSFVTKSRLTSTQLTEIFSSLRCDIIVKFERHSTS